MNNRPNILLADCAKEKVLPFANELHINGEPFITKAYISNWKRTGVISEIRRYAKYFAVGIKYFLKRKQYDTIIGWQQFYALIYCFCCSVFYVQKTNIVIAMNYTYKEKKGKFSAIYRWFMNKCMDPRYLDYIHVPSANYADQIAKDFNFPRERIMVLTFGINDQYDRMSRLLPPEGYERESYALAIGRSNRDYDFLIRAWENVNFPLVIISDTYQGTTDAENITILRNVAGVEADPWVANCGLMIIPIDDGSICSGDTVLLTAMSLKRRILATTPSTLAEMYIKDGENAVLCEKDEEKLRETVAAMLESDRYAGLGEGARRSFLENHSRQSLGQKTAKILNTKA